MAVEFVGRAVELPDRSRAVVPVSEVDAEQVERLKIGEPLAYKAWSPRTLKLQRFYRGMIAWTAQAIGCTHEQLHVRLKIRAALVDEVQYGGERPVLVLRSTAFSDIDQEEFRRYVNLAVNIVLTEILPAVPRGEFIRRIEQMTGIFDWRNAA